MKTTATQDLIYDEFLPNEEELLRRFNDLICNILNTFRRLETAVNVNKKKQLLRKRNKTKANIIVKNITNQLFKRLCLKPSYLANNKTRLMFEEGLWMVYYFTSLQ